MSSGRTNPQTLHRHLCGPQHANATADPSFLWYEPVGFLFAVTRVSCFLQPRNGRTILHSAIQDGMVVAVVLHALSEETGHG